MSASYIFGGDTGVTAESLKRRRAIVDAMIERSQGAVPRNVGEGINAIGGAIGAAIAGRSLRKDEAALEDRQSALWGDLGGAIDAGGGSALAYDPAGPALSSSSSPEPVKQSGTTSALASATSNDPSLMGDIGQYAQSIKGLESGGKYDIVGPTHPKYGRALGAYQVMEANLPDWTRNALGHEVGADEFLASPETQDAVFADRFGGYVKKYGNPQDAASAWLTGRPRGPGNTAKDVFGTDSNAYVSKFNSGLQGGGAAPVQTASADPSFMPEAAAPAPPGTDGKQMIASALAAQGQPVQPNAPTAGMPPLAAPQTVGPNPVPPASQFSPAVQQAAASDPGFDGFAQSPRDKIVQAMMQNGTGLGLPGVPNAPEDASSRFSLPADAAPKEHILHGLEVQQARNGESPAAFLRVLSSPSASDQQRELAGQLLRHVYNRQDEMADRSYAAQQAEVTRRNGLDDYQRKAEIEAGIKARQPGFRTLTQQEATAAGLPSGAAYQVGPDGRIDPIGTGKGQNITVNAGQDQGEFQKRAAGQMADRFGALATSGQASAGVLQTIPYMRELLKVAPQGPIAGRLAEQFPGFSTAGDAFQAGVNQIAPTLRVPGSGAQSDRDMDILMGSFPRLRNEPQANGLIIDAFEKKVQLNLQRSDIANAALRGEITPADADRRIAEIDRQSILPESFRKATGDQPATSGSPAGAPQAAAPRARNPQTGQVIEYRNGQWVPVQ